MPFIIIGSPRTGSTHLVDVLSGHPDIFTNGNVFDTRNTVYVFWPNLTKNTKMELIELRRADPRAFLDRIFSTGFGRTHIGFKIFQGENDSILDHLMQDSSVKKIVLYRRNGLACYSSALVARETGQYSVRAGKKHLPPPKVRFRANKFVAFHTKYSSFYRNVVEKLNKLRQNYYFVTYEDINDPWLHSSLINFIGADPAGIHSPSEPFKRRVKQNPSDILSRFANRNDVVTFLEKHGLVHWEHEGETSLGLIGNKKSPSPDRRSYETQDIVDSPTMQT